METIIVIVVAVIAIFIYRMVTEPSDKEILATRKAEEKATAELVEFKKNEMLFNQFRDYIDELFRKKDSYNETELNEKLSNDFPYYKNGDNKKLFFDLYRAGLIEEDYKTKLYEKGSAFEDLMYSPEIGLH